MLSRLLKRVHAPIFGFLLIFSDLFSVLIVLLSSCGILESIKKCPNLWKEAFVRGSSKAKSPDEFLDDLEVKHSQSQLRKEKEIDVFKYFCEFIQSLESDEGMKVHKTQRRFYTVADAAYATGPAPSRAPRFMLKVYDAIYIINYYLHF